MTKDDIKKKCQKELKEGKSSEEIIKMLYDSGLTITESMKIIMDLLDITLGDAKKLVASHQVWKEVVDAASPLHNDLSKNDLFK